MSQAITPVIPTEHVKVFEAINQEAMSLHSTWATYLELFDTPEKVGMLNRAAPVFFHDLQFALLAQVLLHLSRLTDPMGGKRTNLVVGRLRPLSNATGDKTLRKEVGKALTQLDKACEVLRDHRHKKIAHSDLDVALGITQLPAYSMNTIEDALAAFRTALNLLNEHFHGGKVQYQKPMELGGADALMRMLNEGLRLREIRRRVSELDDKSLRAEVLKR